MYHLSKPEWLEPHFTPADMQLLEDAGIGLLNQRSHSAKIIV
jgi:hypothetical protein